MGAGEQMPMLDLIPFEPELQYMATLHQTDGSNRIYLKGSPEVVMNKCRFMMRDDELIEMNLQDVRIAAHLWRRRDFGYWQWRIKQPTG